jgi:lambda family phage minor tail protein L
MATVFRSPIINPRAFIRRVGGFVAPNLLLTTLAVAAVAMPFDSSHLFNARKPYVVLKVEAPRANLLQTTLAVAPVALPFKQDNLKNKFNLLEFQASQASNLLQTTLAGTPAAVPFVQVSWQKPLNIIDPPALVQPSNLLLTTLSGAPVINYGVRPDIQKLTTTALVEFFEIDLLPIGVNEQYYFHNDVNELGNDVTWQGQVYTRFPIEADGFEWNGTGTQPRPTVRVGNITGLLGALARENEDLVGVKFTRKRTFLKYLDAVNFASGNPTADANVHFTDEVWYVDRKSSENRVFVAWELASAGDLTNVLLPRRQCIQNTCTWRYRSAECGYSGGAVADINDQSTTVLALDACGKRLSSCNLRFPTPAEKPFGGFPAVGLIR